MTIPRYRQIKFITLIGAATNLILGVLKIVVGYVGHSQALIADGFHSLADLLTDWLVLIAAKFGSRQPDLDHPYGHGRIETIGTTVVSFILVLVGVGIAYDGIHHITKKTLEKPTFMVIVIAVIALIIKEILYRVTMRFSRRLNSELLRANAWHHRSDALSSAIVPVVVIASWLGLHYLDAIGAIIIGILIIHMGWKMIWRSTKELIDTGVDEKILNDYKRTILAIDGVKSVHQLRTRLLGGKVFLDVHVLVNPKISVSEGHYVSDQVIIQLKKKFTNVSDVIVHIDPEDDEKITLSDHLPSRDVLESTCRAAWKQLAGHDEIKKIIFHYLRGKIDIELYLPLTILTDQLTAKTLIFEYRQAIVNKVDIDKIAIYFV